MELWNRAMDAIEEHLDHDVPVRELAAVALTSEYQLRRVFSMLAGSAGTPHRRRILIGDRAPSRHCRWLLISWPGVRST
ncbi:MULTISPECIES: AraC family transcriptional regulator [Pseudonocardia]|uniref:Uncharacterized protein n=2 Tax=Pseudonocardia TaxID=1847 RepID=A0A1Y2MMG3_PSEAH|nr:MULTISPECIES: AraC family transcriptional regulator [Pseudonocardia]OSY36430.1 hypothetical protein BG845_05352 [Pseudonocardia autotrophica]BBG05497.1 hypothetical protein Pdca_67060 [Pseudonocardia autotrophica]GEC28022.1 hypothetical protein PSA01_50510 [Pseudonocardia saturnea]